MKHLTYLPLLFAFGALPTTPEEIEVGLDARLAAAGMRLEVHDATEGIDEDRLASPQVHKRFLQFENVRVEYPEDLAELAGAFGLWADQAQPKFAEAIADLRRQILKKLAAYERLKRAKRGKESFSAVVRRVRFDLPQSTGGAIWIRTVVGEDKGAIAHCQQIA